MWGSTIPTIVFSIAALLLSTFCFLGCDFVRLTFGTDDKELYFPNDEYFGLGLFRHQDFSTNKTALSWDHDATCYDYTVFEEGIFRDSNIKTASLLFIISIALSATTLLALLILQIRESGLQKFSIMATIAVVSSGAAILQELVFFDMFKTSGDAVCNDDHYGATTDGGTETWLLDYPAEQYPNLAYMRFFQSCKIGTTGMIALAGFIAQFITTLFIVMNHFFAPDDDFPSPLSKGNAMEEASAPPIPNDLGVLDTYNNNTLGPLAKAAPQVSPQEDIMNTDDREESKVDYENNPLGPLPQSAPQSLPDEDFVDDISYDHTEKEENIILEDDLSIAASTDNDIATINPESSLMSSKALSSGRF